MEKDHLNWFDSNSIIGLVFMLEDCKICLGVRLIQRSNIVKSLKEYEIDVSLFVKGD